MTTTETETYLASPALRASEGDLFNIDAALTEEERAVRDSVRAFVDQKVLPIIGQAYVDGRFPKELIAEMGEKRLLRREPARGVRLCRTQQRHVRAHHAGARAR